MWCSTHRNLIRFFHQAPRRQFTMSSWGGSAVIVNSPQAGLQREVEGEPFHVNCVTGSLEIREVHTSACQP